MASAHFSGKRVNRDLGGLPGRTSLPTQHLGIEVEFNALCIQKCSA